MDDKDGVYNMNLHWNNIHGYKKEKEGFDQQMGGMLTEETCEIHRTLVFILGRGAITINLLVINVLQHKKVKFVI